MKRKSIKNIEKQADDPVCFSFVSEKVTGQTKHKKIIKKVKKWFKVLTALVERCII